MGGSGSGNILADLVGNSNTSMGNSASAPTAKPGEMPSWEAATKGANNSSPVPSIVSQTSPAAAPPPPSAQVQGAANWTPPSFASGGSVNTSQMPTPPWGFQPQGQPQGQPQVQPQGQQQGQPQVYGQPQQQQQQTPSWQQGPALPDQQQQQIFGGM